LRRNLRAIADAALARVLGVMFIVCAPLRSLIRALIFEPHILIHFLRPKMQRLFSSPIAFAESCEQLSQSSLVLRSFASDMN